MAIHTNKTKTKHEEIASFYLSSRFLFLFFRRGNFHLFFLSGLRKGLVIIPSEKIGRPGISEGPEKDREGGPDEKSAVRILPAAIARKCIEFI